MTDISAGQSGSGKKRGKLAVMLVSGALVGFLASMGMANLVDSGALGELDPSREIALLVALIYVIMGLAVGLGALSPQAGARFLNVEDADELKEMRQSLTASGIGCVALGGLLAVLALSGAGGVVSTQAGTIGGAVLLLVGVIYSVRSASRSDELMRSLSRDAAALGYYLLFFVAGGWAAAAHLGFLAPPQMMDVLTSLWAVVLVAAFWVCGKRGMLAVR